MSGRRELAVVGVLVECCAGKALLVIAVLATGGVLTSSPWLAAVAFAVVTIAVWHTAVALQQRGAGR